LKRKRDHDDIQRLAVEAPPSNELLAIDYSYEQSDIMVVFEKKKNCKIRFVLA
jgi:hypothetical protein